MHVYYTYIHYIMYIWLYIYNHLYICIYIYIYYRLYVYIYNHLYICIYIYISFIHTCIYHLYRLYVYIVFYIIYIYIYIYIYMIIYACMYTYIHSDWSVLLLGSSLWKTGPLHDPSLLVISFTGRLNRLNQSGSKHFLTQQPRMPRRGWVGNVHLPKNVVIYIYDGHWWA